MASAKRVSALVGCLALVAAAQACGGQAAPTLSAVTHAAAASPTAVSREADINSAAEQADRLGRERFAAQYAGVELVDARIIVYRRPSAEFDQALRALGLSAEVELRDAPHSAAELTALAGRISADLAYWQGRGVTISTVGPRHDGTAVEVGTPQPDELRPLLIERYGVTSPVVAVPVGPVAPAGG